MKINFNSTKERINRIINQHRRGNLFELCLNRIRKQEEIITAKGGIAQSGQAKAKLLTAEESKGLKILVSLVRFLVVLQRIKRACLKLVRLRIQLLEVTGV